MNVPVVWKANSTIPSSSSDAAKWNTEKTFFQPDLILWACECTICATQRTTMSRMVADLWIFKITKVISFFEDTRVHIAGANNLFTGRAHLGLLFLQTKFGHVSYVKFRFWGSSLHFPALLVPFFSLFGGLAFTSLHFIEKSFFGKAFSVVELEGRKCRWKVDTEIFPTQIHFGNRYLLPLGQASYVTRVKWLEHPQLLLPRLLEHVPMIRCVILGSHYFRQL